MLLDEIDKVSSDYKGDTSSALLEVLDGEQNSKFRDHYVEIPLDLSEVLFIATANDLQTIPRPLLDRMEIIEINSYTENEKEHIAKEHLIPKQIRNHGLKEQQLSIDDEALREMITGYTKEAGVRNLERKIGEICRKTARKILEEKQETVKVTRENLEEFLGRAKFTYQKKNQCDEIGIVRGLAWTSVGGDTLQICLLYTSKSHLPQTIPAAQMNWLLLQKKIPPLPAGDFHKVHQIHPVQWSIPGEVAEDIWFS